MSRHWPHFFPLSWVIYVRFNLLLQIVGYFLRHKKYRQPSSCHEQLINIMILKIKSGLNINFIYFPFWRRTVHHFWSRMNKINFAFVIYHLTQGYEQGDERWSLYLILRLFLLRVRSWNKSQLIKGFSLPQTYISKYLWNIIGYTLKTSCTEY